MHRGYAWLALVLAAFVLYLSLIPFDLHPLPLATAWADFRLALDVSRDARVSRSDVLANVLIFVPTAFALMGALLASRPPSAALFIAAAAAVLAACAMLSLAAEFVEVFTPRRITSVVDVWAQCAGAICGIAAWAVAGPRLTRWLRTAATTDDRLGRVLTGYAAAWAFVNLAPFDITVDLGDLADRFQSGGVVLVPFSGELAGVRLAWDAAIAAISATPLGLLGLVRGMKRGRRSAAGAFAIGAVPVLGIEAAQVFIHSHVADVTDVLCGLAGVALGVLSGGRILSDRVAARDREDGRVSPRAALLLVAWLLLVIAYHWLPFDFVIDTALIRDKLARISLLPFSGYRGSYLSALNDVLVKVGLAVPFGVLFTFAWRPGSPRAIYVGVALALAAVGFSVAEAGQFFVRTRVPDPTDVLLGIAGSYAGVLLGSWLAANRSR